MTKPNKKQEKISPTKTLFETVSTVIATIGFTCGGMLVITALVNGYYAPERILNIKTAIETDIKRLDAQHEEDFRLLRDKIDYLERKCP